MNNTENRESERTEKNRTESGALYLVATPIGNLSDISERARKVLSEVSFVAAEDTRNSGRLLQFFGIDTPLYSYHEHNKSSHGAEIVRRLALGESCALITDAGTPAISDPGEDLVRLCAENNIPVHSVPGCCAAITALSVSGLGTGKFVFEGFLPTQSKDRKSRLEVLQRETRTAVIYEAPHRLRQTLTDFSVCFSPNRKLTVCRELTKLNEEIIRTDIAGACSIYTEKEPKGEYVLVLEGTDETELKKDAFWSEMSVQEHVAYYIRENPDMRPVDAVKRVAKERNMNRNEVYKLAAIKENNED